MSNPAHLPLHSCAAATPRVPLQPNVTPTMLLGLTAVGADSLRALQSRPALTAATLEAAARKAPPFGTALKTAAAALHPVLTVKLTQTGMESGGVAVLQVVVEAAAEPLELQAAAAAAAAAGGGGSKHQRSILEYMEGNRAAALAHEAAPPQHAQPVLNTRGRRHEYTLMVASDDADGGLLLRKERVTAPTVFTLRVTRPTSSDRIRAVLLHAWFLGLDAASHVDASFGFSAVPRGGMRGVAAMVAGSRVASNGHHQDSAVSSSLRQMQQPSDGANGSLGDLNVGPSATGRKRVLPPADASSGLAGGDDCAVHNATVASPAPKRVRGAAAQLRKQGGLLSGYGSDTASSAGSAHDGTDDAASEPDPLLAAAMPEPRSGAAGEIDGGRGSCNAQADELDYALKNVQRRQAQTSLAAAPHLPEAPAKEHSPQSALAPLAPQASVMPPAPAAVPHLAAPPPAQRHQQQEPSVASRSDDAWLDTTALAALNAVDAAYASSGPSVRHEQTLFDPGLVAPPMQPQQPMLLQQSRRPGETAMTAARQLPPSGFETDAEASWYLHGGIAGYAGPVPQAAHRASRVSSSGSAPVKHSLDLEPFRRISSTTAWAPIGAPQRHAPQLHQPVSFAAQHATRAAVRGDEPGVLLAMMSQAGCKDGARPQAALANDGGTPHPRGASTPRVSPIRMASGSGALHTAASSSQHTAGGVVPARASPFAPRLGAAQPELTVSSFEDTLLQGIDAYITSTESSATSRQAQSSTLAVPATTHRLPVTTGLGTTSSSLAPTAVSVSGGAVQQRLVAMRARTAGVSTNAAPGPSNFKHSAAGRQMPRLAAVGTTAQSHRALIDRLVGRDTHATVTPTSEQRRGAERPAAAAAPAAGYGREPHPAASESTLVVAPAPTVPGFWSRGSVSAPAAGVSSVISGAAAAAMSDALRTGPGPLQAAPMPAQPDSAQSLASNAFWMRYQWPSAGPDAGSTCAPTFPVALPYGYPAFTAMPPTMLPQSHSFAGLHGLPPPPLAWWPHYGSLPAAVPHALGASGPAGFARQPHTAPPTQAGVPSTRLEAASMPEEPVGAMTSPAAQSGRPLAAGAQVLAAPSPANTAVLTPSQPKRRGTGKSRGPPQLEQEVVVDKPGHLRDDRQQQPQSDDDGGRPGVARLQAGVAAEGAVQGFGARAGEAQAAGAAPGDASAAAFDGVFFD